MTTAYQPDVPFVPARRAEGPHAQTILGSLLRPGGHVPHVRERWPTADGDFLDVDRVEAPPQAPHVLVLHGLEGSSRAGYVLEVLRGAHARGWGVLALNFRSCSGEPNLLAHSYNSGDPTDALFAIERLRAAGVRGPIVGVGFSLGGSVLLNLLARTGDEAPLAAACAVSVPFDLSACARLIDESPGWNRLYRFVFLRSLKAKLVAKSRRHPEVLDASRIRAAQTIRAFDDAVTAPLSGYTSAEDYYAQCSTAQRLEAIRRPTLLVTADDDPIAPASTLPERIDNPLVEVLRTDRGGHVGFIEGSLSRPSFWGERQALRFLEAALAR
jgi:uncharacterized protein